MQRLSDGATSTVKVWCAGLLRSFFGVTRVVSRSGLVWWRTPFSSLIGVLLTRSRHGACCGFGWTMDRTRIVYVVVSFAALRRTRACIGCMTRLTASVTTATDTTLGIRTLPLGPYTVVF